MGATTRPYTRNVFATNDAMDAAAVASLFAEDGRVRQLFPRCQPGTVGVCTRCAIHGRASEKARAPNCHV